MNPNTQLEALLKDAWLLATLRNGRTFCLEDSEKTPTVSFAPSIAELGQWVCDVDFDGLHLRGSLDSCLSQVRSHIRAYLYDRRPENNHAEPTP